VSDSIHQRINNGSDGKQRCENYAANLADRVRPRVIFIALLECIPYGWYRVDPVYSNPRYDTKNNAEACYVKLLSLFLKE
jgi:hypothetical protein